MVIIVVGIICFLAGLYLGFFFAPKKTVEVEVPVEKIVEKVVYVDEKTKKKKKKVSEETM